MGNQCRKIKHYLKSTNYILILLVIIASVGGITGGMAADGNDPEITPKAREYARTVSPIFNINTADFRYYKVQLALAKSIFSLPDTDSYKITSGERQNFYSTAWLDCGDIGSTSALAGDISQCTNGVGTFTLDSTIWTNLRSSVVFYRMLANSIQNDSDAVVSKIGVLKRTGETWAGLPLNDKAQVYDKVAKQNIYVVENGILKGIALESDYGPRNVENGTRFHPGLDLSVVKGTPVYAIADGKVVQVPTDGDSVHRLNIEHLGGTTNAYLSGYVHLEKAVVSLNENVVAGQLIAYSGDYYKGVVIGAHLHFEAGFTTNQIFHNPLDYVRHTDEHTIASDLSTSTFLTDSNTGNHVIDVRNAAGDQDIVLISFGVTTEHDKDLNYVSVQVDHSTLPDNMFILDYDNVKTQSSSTGEVQLNNGRTFRVRPMSDDIFNDTDLQYDFYVKAADTYTGLGAKDYFYFPWNISALENKEDGGPHIIDISLGEVEDPPVEYSLTIGPEIFPTSMHFVDEKTLTFNLKVFNYDIPENSNGTIQLAMAGLPAGWTASFSEANPSIAVGGDRTITLTLTAPDAISGELMRDNNTRVIAIFERITAFKDNWVFCPPEQINATMAVASVNSSTVSTTGEFCPTDPAEVTILRPTNNSTVPANKVFEVEVSAPGAPLSAQASLEIEDLTDGSWDSLLRFSRTNDTFSFDWTPSEVDHRYGLVAYADGFKEPSSTVIVTAVNDEVIFIQPTHNSIIEGGIEQTVIVEAPPSATKVVLDIFPTNPSAGGEMIKTADGTWKYSGWVPSKDEAYYNLTATATLGDGSTRYTVIRVEPIPDQATIEVQEPVKVADEKTVTVKAKDAFSVYLTANGVGLTEISHNETEWEFSWKPTAGGNYLLYAVVHYNNGDFQYPERTVEVIDEGQNMIIVTIDDPQNGAVVYVGDQTRIIVSSPGDLKKVLLEIGDEDNNIEEKTVTSEDVGGYFMSIEMPWTPAKEGKYNIKAYAWSTDGHKGWTDSPTVVHAKAKRPEDIGIWTPINEYAFLWKNKDSILANFEEANYFNDWTPKLFDTMIPYSEYYCGVVGIAAHGGDIGEKGETQYDQIIQIYADSKYSSSKGTWHLMIDFYTWNETGTVFKKLVDRKETWDIQLLCINRSVISLESSQPGKPVFFSESFTGLGDNVGANSDVSTDIDHSEYVCGIIGFDSNAGDIQEFDDGDIILNYLFRKNNTWNIREEFRTHSGFHENWDIKVFCIHRDWASIDQPEAGKPFVLKEYTNLGDNVSYPTEFSVKDWTCGVVGFAARDGDIDENDQSDGTNLILAYMEEGTEKWKIRADFRTHHNDESWDVNVLCMHKDLSVAPQELQAVPKLFTTRDGNNVLYGPGMALSWEETYHPDAKYYEIQFSEDGGATWQVYTDQRDISYGGWINHHGNLHCGFGFGRCLKRNQIYSYRVRVLDGAKNPLTDWSNVVSATSMEWPAHVEIGATPPDPQVPSHSVVTLDLVNTYGSDLQIVWEIFPQGQAQFSILENTCQNGSYFGHSQVQQCKLRIWINANTSRSDDDGSMKLAAPLMAYNSVRVAVTGTDSLGFSWTDDVDLSFKLSNGDPVEK